MKQPSMVKMIATLAFAGLASGLSIVGIYELTLPRITANKEAALRAAVLEVLPGATKLQALAWAEALSVSPDGEIYGGYDDAGSLVGYAVPAGGPGFQDTIQLLFGYDADRSRVVGMTVLESRETPGLGDGIYKDMDFVDQFRDLVVDPKPELVKGGASEPWQVDAITGATISSKAVVNIVGDASVVWVPRLPARAQAPAWVEVADGE